MAKLVPYLSEEQIERDAAALLAEYEQARGVVIAPPIPIEDIVEKHLKLGIEFDATAGLKNGVANPATRDAFLAELQQAFGSRMGRFTQIRDRAAFPLGLHALKQLTEGRCAAIGNAAQTLHPVAGQGLNLGLRDAYALVDALAQHGATPTALQEFAARRSGDRRLTIAATDTLARLFTIELAPLGVLRGLALGALDWLPPAKTWLARQMMFGQRR